MAKRKIWPWVVGIVIFGWLIGDDEFEKDRENVPTSVVIAKKTDRLQPKAVINPARPQIVAIPQKAPIRSQSLLQGSEATSPTTRTMYVDADRLRRRNGPSLDNNQVWMLKRDEAVRVVGKFGEWSKATGNPI